MARLALAAGLFRDRGTGKCYLHLSRRLSYGQLWVRLQQQLFPTGSFGAVAGLRRRPDRGPGPVFYHADMAILRTPHLVLAMHPPLLGLKVGNPAILHPPPVSPSFSIKPPLPPMPTASPQPGSQKSRSRPVPVPWPPRSSLFPIAKPLRKTSRPGNAGRAACLLGEPLPEMRHHSIAAIPSAQSALQCGPAHHTT